MLGLGFISLIEELRERKGKENELECMLTKFGTVRNFNF